MAKNKIECVEERKTSNGYSYKVHVPYIDELGIRRFYSKAFSEKKYGSRANALEQAKKHRDSIKFKLANNYVVKEKHYSLDEIYNQQMDLYPCTLATKKKVHGTYNKYIRSFIGGDRDFSTIKYNDIQKCLNNMISIAKNDTIQRAFSLWKRLYKHAIANNYINRDETYNIQVPKSDLIENKKPMVVSQEQLRDVIQAISETSLNERDKYLIQSALWIMNYEGMRPSEVFGLEKKNVDLENRIIFVCQSVGTTSTQIDTIKKTKNENSIRTIPLNERLIPIFEQLFSMSINGYLFIKQNGCFMNGTYMSDITRKVSHGTFRPYMLRHQFSTDLLTNGTDVRTIQELMGHKNSNMTIGYARSNDSLKEKALSERVYN